MEENEKEIEEYYLEVIETLSTALKQQQKDGKYDAEAIQNVIDELDLECDRRIVFGEPTDEVEQLKEYLEDFVEEAE